MGVDWPALTRRERDAAHDGTGAVAAAPPIPGIGEPGPLQDSAPRLTGEAIAALSPCRRPLGCHAARAAARGPLRPLPGAGPLRAPGGARPGRVRETLR